LELAETLQYAGFAVRWFEELGGRYDDAEGACLAKVADSDIDLGPLADEPGANAARRVLPANAEYRESPPARQALHVPRELVRFAAASSQCRCVATPRELLAGARTTATGRRRE
jgi:hypothetical protein